MPKNEKTYPCANCGRDDGTHVDCPQPSIELGKPVKRVFICSPYRASTPKRVEHNVAVARNLCRLAAHAGCIPFAPHLLYPQFLDDADERDRAIGIMCGISFLKECDEMWAFGEPTAGMKVEMAKARELGIPVIELTNYLV